MKLLIPLLCLVPSSLLFSQSNTFPTSGNVGVGTLNPQEKLHVQPNANGDVDVRISTNSTTDGTEAAIVLHTSSNQGGNWGARIAAERRGTNAKSDLKFYTTNASGSLLERMRITNSGHVGIGTADPDRGFVVDSSSNSQPAGESSILITGDENKERFGVYSHGGDPGFQAWRSGGSSESPLATASQSYLSFLGGGGHTGTNWTGNSGLIGIRAAENFSNFARGTYISFQTTENGSTSRVERMRVADSGNVGIGVSNPANKLDVKGTIRAEEVIVETGWADFVFEPSYRLRPLDEVEAHIAERGHLPDVPSGKAVEAEGLSMGAMQRVMMQKIEELTLYTISQEKRLAALEAENAELKQAIETR